MTDVFTVGWICSLPVELEAVQVVMDEKYESLPTPTTDTNDYKFGRIGVHNVVAACLPDGQMGSNTTAVVASNMRNSFPSLRFGMLVGIGSGVPSAEHDIRLGDVVISQPRGQHGGVVQFAFNPPGSDSDFSPAGHLNSPPTILLNAVAKLRANMFLNKLHIREHLSAFSKLKRFACPGSKEDVLYSASSDHVPGPNCASCSEEDIITRHSRNTLDPSVFFGTIASGNNFVKDAPLRDRISQHFGGVLCFEIDAAGLMNHFPCLVIRGICDYADAHRNTRWQSYAAATAAAYAKDILLIIPQLASTTGDSREVYPTPRGLPTSSSLSNEDKDCLRSLAFPEQESSGHTIHFAQNTCQWLLMDHQYREWTKKSSGLFWIKGNPGTGKSALMKFAVTTMKHKQPADIVLSHFIDGLGTVLQRSLIGVFRALLNTMLASFPQHLSQLTKAFKDRETRYGPYHEKRWNWAAQELQDFMLQTLSEGTKDKAVIIFIDALDECGEHDAKALLSYFRHLTEQIEMKSGNVKICFSSRHYPILGSDNIPSVSVERQNGKDIQSVVHERLKQITPEESRRRIEDQIISKSQGGFLWAVLVTHKIVDGDANHMKRANLLEILSNVPDALNMQYEDILSSRNGAKDKQMVKLFQWILFAGRPLSSPELREALAADKDTASATIDSLRRHDSWVENLIQFEKYVKHLSRGLVKFQNRDVWEQHESDEELRNREVHFIHHSAAQYVAERFFDRKQEVAGAAHFEISRSCLRYITMSDVLGGARTSPESLSTRFPLAKYAVEYLFYHIDKVEQEGIPQLDLLSLIRGDQPKTLHSLAQLWAVIDPGRVHTPSGWPLIGEKPLHCLIAIGSKSALDAVLEEGHTDINVKDSQGNTPLLFAIKERHPEMALMILNQPIESSHRQSRAMHENTDQDQYMEQQKSYVVDVNAMNHQGETALSVALTRRFGDKAGDLILRLIEAGADLAHCGGEAGLLLHAVLNRDEALFIYLVQQDINLDEAINSVLQQLSYEDKANMFEDFLSNMLIADANVRYPALRIAADFVRALNSQRKYEAGSVTTFHDSGVGTSIVSEERRKSNAGNDFNDDTQTEYSVATQPGDDDFVSELADDLLSHVRGLVHDAKPLMDASEDDQTWNQVFESLPELLQDFALSTGYQANMQIQRDIMVFIHRNRGRITESFQAAHRFTLSKVTENKLDIREWMEGHEGEDQWGPSALPSNIEFPPISLDQDESFYGALDVDDKGNERGQYDDGHEDYEGEEGSEGEEISEGGETITGDRVQMYRTFIQNLDAYKWLRSRLDRAFLMAPAETDILTEIRQNIVQQLPRLRRVSSRTSSVTYRATFQVEWKPHSFLDQQGYLGEPGEAIANALTLSGTTSNAQAMPCAEYLCKTWPLTGEVLLQLMMKVVRGEAGVEHTAKLFDRTQLLASTEASGIQVKASGTKSSLAELAQQLAWLGSALPVKSGQFDQSASTYYRPQIQLLNDTHGQSAENLVWVIKFEAQNHENQDETSIGQCWTSLIRNRVLVQGYPIFRRPKRGSGLEVTLDIISLLLQAPYATVFDGRPFIKGSRSMLVLTEHIKHVFIWHLLESHDESSITYNDPRVRMISPKDILRFDFKDLESSRHFLGWCPASVSLVGTPEANYEIGFSELQSDPDCPFDQRIISPGISISRGKGVSVPQSYNATNAPAVARGSYFRRLLDLRKLSVALFDSSDKRSWLVDGVSALLHLVRVSLESEARNRSSQSWYRFELQEYLTPGSRRSDNVSLSILMNSNNRTQLLFDEMAAGECADDMAETFEQRVEKILCFLNTALESEKLRNKKRENCIFLDGFEFRKIAEATDDVSSCSVKLPSEGGASIKLCRELNAVTLYGKGFGELIRSSCTEDNDLCSSWRAVPKGMGYISVQMSHLQDILEHRTVERHQLWNQMRNLWGRSQFSFRKKCACHEGAFCDYAQTLHTANQFGGVGGDTVGKAAENPPSEGAMIFGRYSHPSDRDLQIESSTGSSYGSSRSGGVSNTTVSHDSSWETPSTSQYTELPDFKATLTQEFLESTNTRDLSKSENREVVHHLGNQETNQLPDGRNQQSTSASNRQSHSLGLVLSWAVALGCLVTDNFYWRTFSISTIAFIFCYYQWQPIQGCGRFAKYLCLAVLLLWLLVLSPIHVFLPTLLDLFTPYQATFTSKPYEIVYSPGNFSDEKISADVFAIHGLGSNSSSAWISRDGNDTHWLRDILPRHTRLQRVRVILLNHQTSWASHSPTMTFHDHARSMLFHIREINKGENPIIFVAHSFGGLLLKQALLYAQSQGNDITLRTKGILFLGVPHYGASNALVARLLACTAYWRGSSDSILKLISTKRRDLEELDDAFRNSFTQSGPYGNIIGPHITNFLEMRPEKLGALGLKETVNREYGKLGYAENVFLDTDHRGLNKFRSPDDANFQLFLSRFFKAFDRIDEN